MQNFKLSTILASWVSRDHMNALKLFHTLKCLLDFQDVRVLLHVDNNYLFYTFIMFLHNLFLHN